jgi:hypothetical protein
MRMRSGRCFAKVFKSLLAVLGFRDFVIGTGKHVVDDLTIIFLALNH